MNARAMAIRWRCPRRGRSPLAERRLVAVRHRHDEVVGVGHAGGSLDVLLGGVGDSVADVLGHRSAEQHGLLEHEAHLAAQGGERQAAHVQAVHEHLALVGVVEPGDELGDRALAGAAVADERHDLARGEVEVDVVQGAGREASFEPSSRSAG